MKSKCFIVMLTIAMSINAQSFESLFVDSTLLIDLQHYGTHRIEGYALQGLSKIEGWFASKKQLIAPENFGNHTLKLYDQASDKLIFSRNYNTLFNEWQSTDEAKSSTKSFGETLSIPLPKSVVRMEIYTRNRQGKYEQVFMQTIDPVSIQISKRFNALPIDKIHIGGTIEQAIDIVILPDGYGNKDREKFIHDCKQFTDAFFSYSPFRENKSKFNVRAVWKPSEESGVTNPGKGEWKRTNLNAQFWTFNSERYLMVENQQTVAHFAHAAPCEFVYILVNTDKYGGGGIYNFYAIGAASHPTKAEKVHVHEFGHLFLGLADEYDGDASVSEFYPDGVEPWEDNITRLIEFDAKDWSKMVDTMTPVPTPIGYKLPKGGVGLYEGGGYLKKGIYRPTPSCMMRDLEDFCPVCQKAIQKEIDRLTR